jgi:hypothetical protein
MAIAILAPHKTGDSPLKQLNILSQVRQHIFDAPCKKALVKRGQQFNCKRLAALHAADRVHKLDSKTKQLGSLPHRP